MLDIHKLGDEVLREKCTEVIEFDNSLKMLEEAMYETMAQAGGVGLAAPQVGVTKRLFVIEIPREGIKKTFVNPQIIETSVETHKALEGCLSLPGLEHEVERPQRVTVFAQDTDGKPFTLSADGLFARAIQHENDHLNGVLYIDHLDEQERLHMERLFKKREQARRKAKRHG